MRYAVGATHLRGQTLQPDSLHLAQRNLVLCPIIELGRSRRLVSGHLLGMLESSVVLQINRDAGRTPGVTSNGGEETRCLGPFRIAAQALYRLRARPVTAVPTGLGLPTASGQNAELRILSISCTDPIYTNLGGRNPFQTEAD
jgi:hypothetical protein